MPDYPYTVRNTQPLPHQKAQGPHICGVSRTLEESIAFVRERTVEDGTPWGWWEILHRDGRRWFWVQNGTHVKMVDDNRRL